jgi:Cu(I)/Ag(I) efflux system membrane fusion protein
MLNKVIAVTAIVVSLSVGSAAVGRWRGQQSGASHESADASATYICPMHPDYRSDHPGDCPICGMRLEAQRPGASHVVETTRTPPIGVRVTAEQQQAIGVRIGVVARSPSNHLLRTTGRVAADANRMYPIIAAVSGSIRNVSSVTSGDAVKKDQVLASFFSPDAQLEAAQQSYYEGLEMLYRTASAPPQAPTHNSRSAVEEVERLADALRSLGVSNSQVRQLAVRRELVHDIRVESPADGIVLQRSVSPGLRFDRGFEFYQIADLNRVWILVDVSRHQLPFLRHGAKARLTTGDDGRTLAATVSASEPIFDEATQTMKVRLEAANPRLALKPGMFVDVEFPIDLPPMLIVPADAIVDSGLRKTVFVDCGGGHFEPRLIETGRRMGDDVEVTKGLAPGERIVISGTFFIDSETRMKSTP